MENVQRNVGATQLIWYPFIHFEQQPQEQFPAELQKSFLDFYIFYRDFFLPLTPNNKR